MIITAISIICLLPNSFSKNNFPNILFTKLFVYFQIHHCIVEIVFLTVAGHAHPPRLDRWMLPGNRCLLTAAENTERLEEPMKYLAELWLTAGFAGYFPKTGQCKQMTCICKTTQQHVFHIKQKPIHLCWIYSSLQDLELFAVDVMNQCWSMLDKSIVRRVIDQFMTGVWPYDPIETFPAGKWTSMVHPITSWCLCSFRLPSDLHKLNFVIRNDARLTIPKFH